MRDTRGKIENHKTDDYVKLGPYTTDVQGFIPYVKELKESVFKFRDEDLKTAKTIVQSVTNTYKATKKHKLEGDGDVTMVSIHVRLTDFKHHLKVLFDMEYISNSFLTKAMTYFTNKYKVRNEILRN